MDQDKLHVFVDEHNPKTVSVSAQCGCRADTKKFEACDEHAVKGDSDSHASRLYLERQQRFLDEAVKAQENQERGLRGF